MKLFGESLVEEGFVTADQLAFALRQQQALRNQPIGEVLVDLRALTRQALDSALPRYFATLASGEKGRRFGDFLVDERLVTHLDLERGLREQRRLRELRIGEVLVRLGFLSPEALDRAVAHQLAEMVAR